MVKVMKAEDLKGKTEDELNKMLLDLRKQQLNLRFQHKGGQVGNTSEMRRTRRDIARVKTFLNAGNSVGAQAKETKKTAAKKTKAA